MRICALGDSIFEGYLVGGKSLIYYLSGKGYDIDNYSVNGFTTDELLYLINKSMSYDIYLVHIGLNDFFNGRSLEYVLNNIYKIIEKLKTLGGRIFIISPYPTSFKNLDEAYESFINFSSVNKKIENLDKILKKKAKDFKVISFFDYAKENYIEEDLIDGIHPNTNLNKRLSSLVEEKLNGHI
ncbi:SGNH/GDSL hydrolase family protein [Peptoniphilus porci]|uniref:GDSL family lipase n=1 Tax=Peptoniphilus porci TaxID=2652280 RepID=A0A1U7M240_9FIRM|nr:SGNH/GDSL hydrolase family protein [Peptoniphilus porci]OLR65678.1 GDSL family lipase [Peptoniphilus porci]